MDCFLLQLIQVELDRIRSGRSSICRLEDNLVLVLNNVNTEGGRLGFAGLTPEEWATLRNAIDVDEEGKIHPKKKDGTGSSKDAAPAESTKVNAPGAKRIKAMLKERWGGDQWMYNWGTRKNTNKVKNPVEGKFLADLDWMRIAVNPVDGSVLCMYSKRLQDLGVSNVTLDEVSGILVVIYAWNYFKGRSCVYPKERPLSENIDDTCS